MRTSKNYSVYKLIAPSLFKPIENIDLMDGIQSKTNKKNRLRDDEANLIMDLVKLFQDKDSLLENK